MASMLTTMHGLLLVAILLAGAAILAHSQPILVYDDNVDEKLLNTLQQLNQEDKRAPRQMLNEFNSMGPSVKRYEFSEFRNLLKGLIASKGGDPGTAHVKPLRFSLGG